MKKSIENQPFRLSAIVLGGLGDVVVSWEMVDWFSFASELLSGCVKRSTLATGFLGVTQSLIEQSGPLKNHSKISPS